MARRRGHELTLGRHGDAGLSAARPAAGVVPELLLEAPIPEVALSTVTRSGPGQNSQKAASNATPNDARTMLALC